MNKAGKVLCLLIVFAILLPFGTDTAMAYSGNVTMKVKKVVKTNKKVKVKVTVSNQGNKEIDVESGVILQKKTGNQWKKITYRKNSASTSNVYVVASGRKKTMIIPLTNFYKRSKLKKGRYRIGIMINNKMKYARFTL